MSIDDTRIEGIGITSRKVREKLIAELQRQGITDQQVLNALLTVPRHLFVSDALAHRAYENTSLPISYNQTISQPYIVALMTSSVLLDAGTLKKTLEIGTGSGYQTAILAQFSNRVYTLERIKGLQDSARQLLEQLHLKNIVYSHRDGVDGWAEEAPFDAILVTAAAWSNVMVETLKTQLKTGGRLVIPFGPPNNQQLHLITRKQQDAWEDRVIARVRFVPVLSGISMS